MAPNTEVDGLLQNITARNQLTSPLLKLPVELRNKIYEYALRACTLVVGYETPRYPKSQVKIVGAEDGADPSSIILACRQIYTETQDLVYPLVTFKCDIPKDFVEWIHNAGNNIAPVIASIAFDKLECHGHVDSQGVLKIDVDLWWWWWMKDLQFSALPCLKLISFFGSFDGWESGNAGVRSMIEEGQVDVVLQRLLQRCTEWEGDVGRLNPGVEVIVKVENEPPAMDIWDKRRMAGEGRLWN